MFPARQINPPSWMMDSRSEQIMRVLGGYEMPIEALFVGGCVRNTLLDKPVEDIDIATIHPPLTVIDKLTKAGIRYLPTGLDHGTVTAIVDDTTFEITTLRKDVETDGRHAVIAFTTDWKEDAERRDFTINTLLASMDGMIFDPTGAGLSDLDIARVAFVGDAFERVAEDYLRILRYFRFYAQYGAGAPDEAALAACRKGASKLSMLSKERITQEFLKIIAIPDAARILDLMFSCEVLKDIAKSYDGETMAQFCDLQSRYESMDVVSRLFLLSDAKPDAFDQWLVLSNAQKRQLEVLATGSALLKPVNRKKLRELVYRVGNQAACQVYLLHLAVKDAPIDLDLLDVARYWQAPEFPLSGDDLMKAGIPPGPNMGKKLKELEEKWVDSDFSKIPKV